jgi:single-stranded DNA-binding protein
MIIQTKTGTKITGTLSRDPSLKETKTGKPFLSLSVKAHSTKDASGNRSNMFVECCIWSDLDKWDGLLQKGDFVEICGGELKSNTGANGTTYWNLHNVEGVVVGGLVAARWVQMAIDMMQPTGQAGTNDFAPVEDETPFDPGAQPAQTAFPAEPVKQPTPEAAPDYNGDDRPISDTDDLPF